MFTVIIINNLKKVNILYINFNHLLLSIFSKIIDKY